MMYPFMTLDDETEITHSEFLPDDKVKVYVEKADVKDGFHDMTCYLPSYEITSVHGFSKAEQDKYMEIIRSTAHLIMEFSKDGGFENASGF
ncbi:hypothetical protein [Selenomonas ruminantium]|uniref:hypothetical protein n=1 Tax=Selenomonas ruminantium TaxID=971 RepID=UPI001569014F|nr:hypothetical protein [Selenomonas ruminantium]